MPALYKTARVSGAAVVLLVFLFASIASGEDRRGFWKSYFNSNDIRSIAAGDDFVWCATAGGLVRWDTLDGSSWTTFTTKSGLVDNAVSHIAEIGQGIMLFVTPDGVSRYDGSVWRNSPIGEWLLSPSVSGIAEDGGGNLWFATRKDLTRFDGAKWKSFSQLPVRMAVVDRNNDHWYATSNGVLLYDHTSWVRYTRGDGLSSDDVRMLAVDSNNVKWIGATDGISSFSDPGQDESEPAPETITLRGNYPNPFNMVTRISFELASWGPVTCTVYNSAGQKIREIREGILPRGIHSVFRDSTDENGTVVFSGMYFFRIASGKSRVFGRMMLLK